MGDRGGVMGGQVGGLWRGVRGGLNRIKHDLKEGLHSQEGSSRVRGGCGGGSNFQSEGV